MSPATEKSSKMRREKRQWGFSSAEAWIWVDDSEFLIDKEAGPLANLATSQPQLTSVYL